MSDYDVEAIRADFPILSKKVYGKPLIYLDNGASAQKPKVVIDAVNHVYAQEYANVHRGLHYMSNATTAAYEASREKVRQFLNAKSFEEIIFTRSSTEAINLVAHSYGGSIIGEGDEIILSIMEHHSNIVPWHFLREHKGAVIKWAPVDEGGNFLMEDFKALFSSRTKLVAITQMSNAIGTILPINDICDFAHSQGVPVLVDGSQGAVHLHVDVQDLDADFYCMTGHKLYGPTGIGVLYAKRALLDSMPPFMGGGEMIKDVTMEAVTYNDPPHRFEPGTPPIAQAIGLGAALEYMESIGRDKIAAHEAELSAYAKQRLGEINSIRLVGEAEEKGAIFSFELEGIHAHDVSTFIDRSGVAVRAGTHCAQPLLKRFGVTSTCRASFGMYNTKAEVDGLIGGLIKAQEFFA